MRVISKQHHFLNNKRLPNLLIEERQESSPPPPHSSKPLDELGEMLAMQKELEDFLIAQENLEQEYYAMKFEIESISNIKAKKNKKTSNFPQVLHRVGVPSDKANFLPMYNLS
ncbi:hypothetical protein ACFE04_001866 [Oxalis oulophora]